MKRTAVLTAGALALLLSASVVAQTLSQSTNGTSITVATQSSACSVGSPPNIYTVDNGYFRSYPLAGQLGNIAITSIRFGVQQVTSTTGSRPMQIRLYSDPNGGAPSPFSSLILRHTESFSLPVSGTMIIVQPMTGPTQVFMPSETLVVEVYSPSGGSNGNSFFIGSNALGQSAPGYIRAAACLLSDPGTFASIGSPNVHIIIDVNYAPSGQTVPFPGTNEDLTLYSAVNANPLTTGIGNTTKMAVAGNYITLRMVSNGGTFNYRELVFIGEPFVTGFPPSPPAAPGVHLSFAGLFLLIGGPGPLGPVLLPPGGTTVVFQVPPGLAGMSALFQAVVLTYGAPLAVNGLYASTDGHQILIQ